MKWLVTFAFIVIIATKITTSQQMAGRPPIGGSCASINYTRQCCPPSSNRSACKATDAHGLSPCQCNSFCHRYYDCCNDVNCTADPRTCEDYGIKKCCTHQSGENPGYCDVLNRWGDFVCSCDASCHRRNDCCSDINTIGCPLPQNCSAAGKQPGCCTSTSTSGLSCYIPGGECYCDSYCVVKGDCCNDVPLQCRGATASTWKNLYKSAETPSDLEQDLQALCMHAQKDHPQRQPTHSEYDNRRMALAARMERMHTNAKKFRGRARARVAARPPAQYNYDYNY